MQINFKTDHSKKLNKGYLRKTVTVDGKTFTLIGSGQDSDVSVRWYTLKGPGVHLHTDGVGVLYNTSLMGGPAASSSTAVADEVSLGRGMAIHTAEAKAKKIIRLALGEGA